MASRRVKCHVGKWDGQEADDHQASHSHQEHEPVIGFTHLEGVQDEWLVYYTGDEKQQYQYCDDHIELDEKAQNSARPLESVGC